jgi:hypothetical protein
VIAGIIHEMPTLRSGHFCFKLQIPTIQSLRYNRTNLRPRQESALTESNSTKYNRAGYFTLALLLINTVNDGWNGRPSPLEHQLLLLPFTLLFLCVIFLLVRTPSAAATPIWTPHCGLLLALLFELSFAPIYLYECRHFSAFGYSKHLLAGAAIFLPVTILIAFALWGRLRPTLVFLATIASYVAGIALSIISFPLNYLRSDMLPVILWADQALLRHADPYTTMVVGNRLYDFPYLPGMMLSFYPIVAAHLDIRFCSMLCIVALACIFYGAARSKPHDDRRLEVAALIALFILCPFVQYRHDLYLQPHWLTLGLAFVLMQRRRFVWAALVFGVSMSIYQFSWILFPFFLLNALRRRGWLEALKLAVVGAASALLVVGPFLRAASTRISSNTVGQWGHLSAHAQATPMNLSFWLTYLVHPDRLLRVQAVLMVGIFAWCFFKRRCLDLADTLRWMIIALTIFILCNTLVDGYFFLMLSVVLLVYVCVANEWWAEPRMNSEPNPPLITN